MAVSVAAVMRHIHNFFFSGYRDGQFSILRGMLMPAPSCPYVYIRGSAWHDGVHALNGVSLDGLPEPDDSDCADDDPKAETFNGRVYELHPPNDFLELCVEISTYDDQHPVGEMQSESFGDYSYNRGSQSGGWQNAFRERLRPYRRMYAEVDT